MSRTSFDVIFMSRRTVLLNVSPAQRGCFAEKPRLWARWWGLFVPPVLNSVNPLQYMAIYCERYRTITDDTGPYLMSFSCQLTGLMSFSCHGSSPKSAPRVSRGGRPRGGQNWGHSFYC